MIKPASLVLLLFLLAACTYSPPFKAKIATKADQDRDSALIASILQAADSRGAAFQMAGLVVDTGGSIPQGKQVAIRSSGSGTLKAGRARMAITLVQPKASYALVYADGQVYARTGSSAAWRSTDAAAITTLFVAVRLSLIREAVLLARSISTPKTETIPEGSSHHYQVTPAPDQLEQLLSVSASGSSEEAFLRSAGGRLDIYLAASDNQLLRIEVRGSGTDPASGTKERVDSLAAFKVGGKIGAITVPAGATAVQPNQILTG